jgi:hypothetical protein
MKKKQFRKIKSHRHTTGGRKYEPWRVGRDGCDPFAAGSRACPMRFWASCVLSPAQHRQMRLKRVRELVRIRAQLTRQHSEVRVVERWLSQLLPF